MDQEKPSLKDKMKNGYSMCYNEWALDKDIKNELGLLMIISSLCAANGYCYAKNSTLAELFDIDEYTICRKIKKLEQKGYIKIEYKKMGYMVTQRNIRLTKKSTADCGKSQPPIAKKVKYNNTISNNTNTNIYKIKDFKSNVNDNDLQALYDN